MAHNDQSVDVTLRKKAEQDIGIVVAVSSLLLVAPRFLKGCYLQNVRDDIPVRDHHPFLQPHCQPNSNIRIRRGVVVGLSTHRQPGRSTRVAQKRSPTRCLPGTPADLLHLRQRFPSLNKL